MKRPTTPIFLSDGEVNSLEKKTGEALLINVGRASTFSNMPPRDPWVIDDDVDGVTPYSLWFGMTQVVGRNLADQFEAGVALVSWIHAQIESEGLDPFKAIPEGKLPVKFRKYVTAWQEAEAKASRQANRADIYLVNGLYFVAGQVSLDPGVLSGQYKILPHNRVDYSVVYNPDWGKMSIGANTLGGLPWGSATMTVYQNLQQARELYHAQGKLYLPAMLNLDVCTAAMLAEGHDLALPWLRYVEALKLGNFSGRLNKRLPDLTQVGERLSKLDSCDGYWGGGPTFQGSPRGSRTGITDIGSVLSTMAEVFPVVFEGVEPVRLMKSGEK